ncbi:hypothetical protein [Legionella cardiaca]|uniref:Uncharacterized protein n=1 Tax=Legionella cardiaca TaxID=1071983 RepID=A0ABY8ASV4_9GAMM|nr:hypothetical protein [Legionella cardiaca]WED42849.1 hypothetical protein PXX05_13240 [Legionella cardiaca]
MPEILTKYPEKVLQVLQGSNSQCGAGKSQKILINCPQDRFCSLPTGELCVYGVSDLSKMTQIQFIDLFRSPGTSFSLIVLLALFFVLGLLTGAKMAKKNKI